MLEALDSLARRRGLRGRGPAVAWIVEEFILLHYREVMKRPTPAEHRLATLAGLRVEDPEPVSPVARELLKQRRVEEARQAEERKQKLAGALRGEYRTESAKLASEIAETPYTEDDGSLE